MDIEEYIEKIVDNGRIEDMETLSDMLEDTLEIIKDYDEECYKEMEMKLYKMAFGSHINKSMAQDIVHKMKPYGERWRYEETRDIQRKKGIDDIDECEFYVVINYAYNVYKNIFLEDLEAYAEFAINFINNENMNKEKLFNFFID